VSGFDQPEPGRFVPQKRVVDAIGERRVDLINMTIGPYGEGPNRYRESLAAVAFFDGAIAANSGLIAKIESAADIAAARASGKLGVIYNFQDTVALEGDASRVDEFAGRGVKVIQLTYNRRNLAGDGCLESSDAGLSDFGREVIARMNAARVLLDLSHAGQRTLAEAIAASRAPPTISHGGCRALADNPRNTNDAELRALAEKGGVFGIYLMPFLSSRGRPGREDVLRHLEHALNVCGEEHVGIGTDNPLMGFTIDDAGRAAQRRFYEDRARRGIANPGEAADVFNMVEDYNSVDRFDRLAADLRRRGWAGTRIDKVLGGNFVRLFAESWGA
jgi:membrane dipeptidase